MPEYLPYRAEPIYRYELMGNYLIVAGSLEHGLVHIGPFPGFAEAIEWRVRLGMQDAEIVNLWNPTVREQQIPYNPDLGE